MSAAVGLAVAIALLAMAAVGLMRFNRAVQAPAPQRWLSILQLQRAGSGAAMAPLLERLGARGRKAFKDAMPTDGWLIVPGYAGGLAVLSLVGVHVVRCAGSGAWEAVGTGACVLSALLALGAGGLDLVENRALGRVLDSWQDITVPAKPADAEAAQRQEQRRQQVAAIDADCRKAAAATKWKFRCLGLVGCWLLAVAVIWLTDLLW